MIIIYKKLKKQVLAFTDVKDVSQEIGVSRDLIKRRLPFFEDADVVMAEVEPVKSKRGGLNNKNLGK